MKKKKDSKNLKTDKNEKYIINKNSKRRLYLSLSALLLTGLIVAATVTSVALFTSKKNETEEKINLSTLYNDLTPENKEISKSYNYTVFSVPENIIDSYNKLHKSFDLENFNSFVDLLSNDYNDIYENIGIKKLDRLNSSLSFSSSPDELEKDYKRLTLNIKDEYEHSVSFTINFLFNQSINEFINTDNISNDKHTTIQQEEKEEDIGNNKQEKINVTTISTSFIAKEFSSVLVQNTNAIKSTNDFTVIKYNNFVESLPNEIRDKTSIQPIENPKPDNNYTFVLLNNDFSATSESLSFSILNKEAYTKLVVNINKISDSISLLTNITDNEDIKNKIEEDLNNNPSESTISINNFDVDDEGKTKPINNIDDLLNSDSAKEQLGLNDDFDKKDYEIEDSGENPKTITITTTDDKKIIIEINNSPTDEDKIKDSSTNITDNKDHKDQILEDITNNEDETTINITYISKALSDNFVSIYNKLRNNPSSSYSDLISSIKENEPRLYGLIQPKDPLKNTTFTIDDSADINNESTELNFSYRTTINAQKHTTKYKVTIKKDNNDFIDNTSNNDQNKPTDESNKVPNKENEYKKEVNFVLDSIPYKIVLFYNNYKFSKQETTLINLLKELNTIPEIKKQIDFNTNIEGLYSNKDVVLNSDLKTDSNKIELEFNFKDTNKTSKITYVLNRLDSTNNYVDNIVDETIPNEELSKETITLNRYFLGDSFKDETVNIYNSLKTLLGKENVSSSLIRSKYKELANNLNSVYYNNYINNTDDKYTNKVTINPDILNPYTYDKYTIELSEDINKDSNKLQINIKQKDTNKTVQIIINKDSDNQNRIQQLFNDFVWKDEVSNTYIKNSFAEGIDAPSDNSTSSYLSFIKSINVKETKMFEDLGLKIISEELINSYSLTFSLTKEEKKLTITITSGDKTKTLEVILSNPVDVISNILDKDNTNISQENPLVVDDENKTITYNFTYISDEFSEDLVNAYNDIPNPSNSETIKAFTDKFAEVSSELKFKDDISNFTKTTETLEKTSPKLEFEIKDSEWTLIVNVTRKSKYDKEVIEDTITGPDSVKDILDEIEKDPSTAITKEINIDVYIGSTDASWVGITEDKWNNINSDLVTNLNKVLETSKLNPDWNFKPTNFIKLEVSLATQNPVNADKISFKMKLTDQSDSYIQYNITRHDPVESTILDTSDITISDITSNDDISIAGTTLSINYSITDEATIDSFNTSLSNRNIDNAIVEINKWINNTAKKELNNNEGFDYVFSLDGDTNKLAPETDSFNLEIKEKNTNTTLLTYKFVNKDKIVMDSLFANDTIEFSIYDETYKSNFESESKLNDFLNNQETDKAQKQIFLNLLKNEEASPSTDNLSPLVLSNDYSKTTIQYTYKQGLLEKELSITVDMSYKAIAEFFPTITNDIKEGLKNDSPSYTYTFDINPDLSNLPNNFDELKKEDSWKNDTFQNERFYEIINNLEKDEIDDSSYVKFIDNNLIILAEGKQTFTPTISPSKIIFELKYKSLTVTGNINLVIDSDKAISDTSILDTANNDISYNNDSKTYEINYKNATSQDIADFNDNFGKSVSTVIDLINKWMPSPGTNKLIYSEIYNYEFSFTPEPTEPTKYIAEDTQRFKIEVRQKNLGPNGEVLITYNFINSDYQELLDSFVNGNISDRSSLSSPFMSKNELGQLGQQYVDVALNSVSSGLTDSQIKSTVTSLANAKPDKYSRDKVTYEATQANLLYTIKFKYTIGAFSQLLVLTIDLRMYELLKIMPDTVKEKILSEISRGSSFIQIQTFGNKDLTKADPDKSSDLNIAQQYGGDTFGRKTFLDGTINKNHDSSQVDSFGYLFLEKINEVLAGRIDDRLRFKENEKPNKIIPENKKYGETADPLPGVNYQLTHSSTPVSATTKGTLEFSIKKFSSETITIKIIWAINGTGNYS